MMLFIAWTFYVTMVGAGYFIEIVFRLRRPRAGLG
jgi:hypothetical protein